MLERSSIYRVIESYAQACTHDRTKEYSGSEPAADTEWAKFEKLAVWQSEQRQEQKKDRKAQVKARAVQFATFSWIVPPQELEVGSFKSGDVVKDDFGSRCVWRVEQ